MAFTDRAAYVDGKDTATRALEELLAAVKSAGALRRCEFERVPGLRGLRPVQLEALVTDAVAAGLLADDGTQLTSVSAAEVPQSGPRDTAPSGPRPLRAVAIDFESVVRTTASAPYVERRAFQVAALRFGHDQHWVRERQQMSAFCALPDAAEGSPWQIHPPAVAARHELEAVAADVWLTELDAVLDGADVVVAYNGLELDFPRLDQERERAGMPGLAGVELVDGLLLAQSIWPNPPNDHRLAALAQRLEVDLDGFVWHEALSDCRMLATICLEGGSSWLGEWIGPSRSCCSR